MGPNGQFLVGYLTMAQELIALFYTPLEALPLLEKPVFHVEHSPVQVLSSGAGRTGQQVETIGIDNLYGQLLRQLSHGSHGLSRNLDLYIPIAVPAHTDAHPMGIQLPVDRGVVVAMGYQGLDAAAKAPGHGQQVYRLENTGFATAVAAVEHIYPLQTVQVYLVEIPDMVDLQSG